MLQTLICLLPNAECSSILPVKFPCAPLCLPRTALDCQASMAHTKVTPKLEHSAETTHAFAQVSQGLWGKRYCQSSQPSSNTGSCFWLSPSNHWAWNIWCTSDTPLQTYPSLRNSLLVSRGLPQETVCDTAYLTSCFGWHILRCHSQREELGLEFSLKAGTCKFETQSPNFHTRIFFNVYRLILTVSYFQIHQMETIRFPLFIRFSVKSNKVFIFCSKEELK